MSGNESEEFPHPWESTSVAEMTGIRILIPSLRDILEKQFIMRPWPSAGFGTKWDKHLKNLNLNGRVVN